MLADIRYNKLKLQNSSGNVTKLEIFINNMDKRKHIPQIITIYLFIITNGNISLYYSATKSSFNYIHYLIDSLTNTESSSILM